MTPRVYSVTFEADHLALIQPREGYKGEVHTPEVILNIARLKHTHTRTVLVNGRPAAIVGLIEHRLGVAEVWAITSDLVRDQPKAFHIEVLRLIDIYWRMLSLHRLSMTVREDFVEGRRWAEALGFKREGLMYSFGLDRSNHYLYARTA